VSAPHPLIIVGGGLAGSLAALALARSRPDVPLLLLEAADRFGGNHIWSIFNSDLDSADRPLLDALEPHSWPEYEVCFPARRRRLRTGYNSVRSASLDRLVRAQLRPDQFRTGEAVAALHPTGVVLTGGERLRGCAVIDARGPAAMPGLKLGWQKFVGRTYRYPTPHGVPRPVVMDATVPQTDGYRFLYFLPFSDTELLIEDTYYADGPELDAASLGEGIDAAAQRLGSGWQIEEETGVLPVVLGGSVESLWNGDGVPRLGLRGGFFHPTTGYSLPDALRNARLLTQQRDLSAPALHALLRDRAVAQWQDRRFFQLLNRMLFRAAQPDQRFRVLEHFYRLPERVVERFYAARLTPLDKLRILSGRPPVPIGRALAAMREQAA
jgi:lycopene beta-cyclase